jgi:hypothetical protein
VRLSAAITVRDHGALGDAPPVYDVTRVQLFGSLQPTAADDAVRVLAGRLVVTTSAATYGFSATPGQCVASARISDATGQSYTGFTVASCQGDGLREARRPYRHMAGRPIVPASAHGIAMNAMWTPPSLPSRR